MFSFNVTNYNLKSQLTRKGVKASSVYFGNKSLSSLALKMWDLVPDSFKNEKSLKRSKSRTKTRTTDKRSCRICKVYIGQVGFILVVPTSFIDLSPWIFVLLTNLFTIYLMFVINLFFFLFVFCFFYFYFFFFFFFCYLALNSSIYCKYELWFSC